MKVLPFLVVGFLVLASAAGCRPPPVREAQQPLPAGGYYPNPTYPAQAMREQIEGDVGLRVLVGVDGIPTSVDVRESSGHEILDSAAIRAVKQWRFPTGRTLTNYPTLIFRLR